MLNYPVRYTKYRLFEIVTHRTHLPTYTVRAPCTRYPTTTTTYTYSSMP